MRKIFLGALMCIIGGTLCAQEHEYYIEGDISIRRVPKGGGKYEAEFVLHNPIGVGISFDRPAGDSIRGRDEGSGTRSFLFRNADTECVEGLNRNPLPLHFYRQQPNGEWQIDSETKVGTAERSKTSWTTIVLVLDRTTSLGEKGLSEVKSSAIQFIRDVASQDNSGSVHIGIVGFADQPNILPIMPLTSETKPQIEAFINNFTPRNNTYLYYAMDEAVSLIENYYPTGKTWANCQGISMITFTDGFDNGSINVDKDLMTNDKYFLYLNQRIRTNLHGYYMDSYMISIKGKDVKEESLYVDKLKSLASNESQFFKVENTSKLQQQFAYILDKLTVHFTDLKCNIPQYRGRVRWVLECGKPKPEPKPKKEKKCIHQLGVILGANEGLTYKVFVPDKKFAFQWDFGFNVVTQSLDVLTTNFMYQNSIRQGKKSNFYLYAGAGFSVGSALGYEYWSYWNGENYVEKYQHHNGGAKLGFNAIVGLEWMFKKSFALSLDYRPGIDFIEYSEIFYFNYLNLNLGLRWYF